MSLNLNHARENMVENQIRTWDVLDRRVLDMLAEINRADFVPRDCRNLAFADIEIPIGHGEVMMKPVVEARILQALAIESGHTVLEIGTGSGFLSACMAALGAEVTTVEQHADLAERARHNLDKAGFGQVKVEVGEGLNAYAPTRKFDRVVLSGAVFSVPERVRSWVADSGQLFAIVGESPAMQALLHRRSASGHWQNEALFETDFPYLNHAAPPPRFTF